MTKKIKKYTNDEGLAKIKVLMNEFYANVGREEFEDVDEERKELIEDIDDIINDTEISSKHLIIERLEKDNEGEEE